MLSEEKVVALKQMAAEWGTENKVPQNIQNMVVEMGIENPRTPEEKQNICQEHLWSDAIIKWYDNFIKYLESKRTEQQSSKDRGDFDLVLSLKTAIRLLTQIVDHLEGHSGD